MDKLNKLIIALNSYFKATHIINARKAIILLVNNRANVIDSEYNRYNFEQWKEISKTDLSAIKICSKTFCLNVPSVVILDSYSSYKVTTIKFSRHNIFTRDKFTCQYCGQHLTKKNISIDHIIPKSRGGTNTWNNIVACCRKCNVTKKDKLLEEINWKLITIPVNPNKINAIYNNIDKQYWKFLE